ncbi:MAG: RNA-binding domain-containing protein [Candidatus Methanomethylicia archaeon]
MSLKDFPIAEILINAFCHATEDLEKVRKAMLNFIPELYRSRIVISEDVLEGYYGNRILNLKIHISDVEIVKNIIDFICRNIHEADKKLISRSFLSRLDSSGNLYLRFDKGAAYNGLLRLHDGSDVVRVVIKFKVAKKLIKDFCVDIGLIMGV